MEPGTLVNVHHVVIARSAELSGPPIYTAICRLCGTVIERRAGPLTIKTPGLYAVQGGGTPGSLSWSPVEHLQPGMQRCTTTA